MHKKLKKSLGRKGIKGLKSMPVGIAVGCVEEKSVGAA